jgi:hypothetical protein
LAQSRVVRFAACATQGIDLSTLTTAAKDARVLSLLSLVGQQDAALAARNAEPEARLAKPERPGNVTVSGCRRSGRTPPGCCCSAGAAPAAVSARSPPPPGAGLEPGSPFGKSAEALVVYLHDARATGPEWLRCLPGEIFALSIGEGALCTILARAATLKAAEAVASDETPVRVMKKMLWERVFVTAFAVLHIIRPGCGAAVVRALFGTIRPRVRVSNSLGSQRRHADIEQMCLAHRLRDMPYATGCGNEGFPVQRFSMRLSRIGAW